MKKLTSDHPVLQILLNSLKEEIEIVFEYHHNAVNFYVVGTDVWFRFVKTSEEGYSMVLERCL